MFCARTTQAYVKFPASQPGLWRPGINQYPRRSRRSRPRLIVRIEATRASSLRHPRTLPPCGVWNQPLSQPRARIPGDSCRMAPDAFIRVLLVPPHASGLQPSFGDRGRIRNSRQGCLGFGALPSFRQRALLGFGSTHLRPPVGSVLLLLLLLPSFAERDPRLWRAVLAFNAARAFASSRLYERGDAQRGFACSSTSRRAPARADQTCAAEKLPAGPRKTRRVAPRVERLPQAQTAKRRDVVVLRDLIVLAPPHRLAGIFPLRRRREALIGFSPSGFGADSTPASARRLPAREGAAGAYS